MMREQRLAGPPHRLGVLALLGRQRGVEEQAGHPDHAVHRRPDLVAHGGQELALAAGRLLRGAPRLRDAQCLLGDVARDEHPEGHEDGDRQGGCRRLHEDLRALRSPCGVVNRCVLEDQRPHRRVLDP